MSSTKCKAVNPSLGQIVNPNSIIYNYTIKEPGRKSLIDSILDLPFKPCVMYDDIVPLNNAVEDPDKKIEKQAARMIVIRRRKMKRHRLKKLRKRMKFEWAKVRQRREMKKEKMFQAELMGHIKEANKFDPRAFAVGKIERVNEVLIPTRWKGKLYPDFIINELITRKEKKVEKFIEREKRRKQVDLNPSNYKY